MNRLIAAMGILMLLGAQGCKKYPDGPTVSLLPRSERIEGKWKATKVLFNDIDSTTAYKSHIWEFTRAGSVILQISNTKYTGIWSTITNDKEFSIDYDNGTREIYTILKLKRKEFWIRNKKTELEYQLVPQ